MGTGALISTGLITAATFAVWASAAASETPLSMIDWLETDQADDTPSGPSVTTTAALPSIDVRPLTATKPAVGLVPANVTGLPEDLWQGASAETLIRLVLSSPVERHPALQALLYSMLLTEAVPPKNETETANLMLARIDKLVDLGALEPAQALAEAARPEASAGLFRRWSDIAFLTGGEDAVCASLGDKPYLSPDRETLIFCAARRGYLDRASLLFETSRVLGDLDPRVAPVLDRFLYPEFFEDADPLPQPRAPSPLAFRLYEAIGEPVPTASLPRRFAASDLRDIAGWKAQLEAAERLARTGAIASNTFLGVYTARLPAASGGVWDRVAAVQRFETALRTGSAAAVEKTLPTAWSYMSGAGLDVLFSDLFAANLATVALDDPASRHIAREMAVLSEDFMALTTQLDPDTPQEAVWIAIAQGKAYSGMPASPLSTAIVDGFSATVAPAEILKQPGLGQTLLRAIVLFDQGANGNLSDMTEALVLFRAAGLEDTARRAALQVLIRSEG